MLKSDRWIRKVAREHDMINPFSEKQVREGVISYGLSSYGYDLRVADEFKIFTNVNSTIVDPKHFDEKSFVTVRTDICIVPPNSFALARSVEYFKIPRDILTICVGKSTYARCGIIVNVTPFEPEWEGFVTLEISNTTPLPARIYANEGLCQILFFQSDEVCETSYADRKGKYQSQQGIVLAEVVAWPNGKGSGKAGKLLGKRSSGRQKHLRHSRVNHAIAKSPNYSIPYRPFSSSLNMYLMAGL
jgi:dCTP deaminase